jgi:RNA polymerase sigma factor (sigma-70 family)
MSDLLPRRGFTIEQNMTDSRTLLADYVEKGSESAFRELVDRYFDLVYSTALRLTRRDTHLAEDVAQTVFISLARRGRTLSKQVMLGGWLHQYTFHVATKAVRGELRRQSRDREAVQMNAQHDHTEATWRKSRRSLTRQLWNLEWRTVAQLSSASSSNGTCAR